jgi:serine/threonine protein kinase
MRPLGGGAFGKVYLVKHRCTGIELAMKILDKKKYIRKNMLRYAMAERNILCCIRHPFIVSLSYCFQTPDALVLVLQYCPGGDLQMRIEAETKLDEQTTRVYSAEVLTALEYLHERQIIYRDLKPENIVFDQEGHAVLTDFGLSKEGVVDSARSFVGSLAYMAPEVVQNLGHNHTVDIYALGANIYVMLVGSAPYTHPGITRDMLQAKILHATLDYPPFLSQQVVSLLTRLLQRVPSERLGADTTADVKHHDFFAPIDFAALLRREVAVPAPRVDSTRSSTSSRCAKAANINVMANPFLPKARRSEVGVVSRTCKGFRKCVGLEFPSETSWDQPASRRTPNVAASSRGPDRRLEGWEYAAVAFSEPGERSQVAKVC